MSSKKCKRRIVHLSAPQAKGETIQVVNGQLGTIVVNDVWFVKPGESISLEAVKDEDLGVFFWLPARRAL